jgi:hypothetical protein
MFRREGNQIQGVLNDFDLSSIVDPNITNDSSNQRTGTKPFMAIDLLITSRPPKHLYRHDLESFPYVLLFLASRYQDGLEINNPPLSK